MAIAAIIIAGIIGLVARVVKTKPLTAWLIGCTIVPIFVLVVEFVLPYQGGGASMWPIALIFGGVYGAISSAVGVFIAEKIARDSRRDASLMNLDELVNSIKEDSHREQLAKFVDDWKKDNRYVEALGFLIGKWHGNVWFESQEDQNKFYEDFSKFKTEAINKIGGMTVNERLYWFGLFEEWDSTDEKGHLRIREKLHAMA